MKLRDRFDYRLTRQKKQTQKEEKLNVSVNVTTFSKILQNEAREWISSQDYRVSSEEDDVEAEFDKLMQEARENRMKQKAERDTTWSRKSNHRTNSRGRDWQCIDEYDGLRELSPHFCRRKTSRLTYQYSVNLTEVVRVWSVPLLLSSVCF